jgi:hypothetical protein
MLQDVNICLEIFQYLHLDEWFHFLYLNKFYNQILKRKMVKFVQQMGKNRLNDLIKSETKMNYVEFWEKVQSVNGQVTGSIHLQVLLGKHKFKSHDVDVFILENEADKDARTEVSKNFSILHRFLFEHSTGMISDNNELTDKQRKSADRNVRNINVKAETDDLQIIQKEYESECIVEEVENIYQIKNVYTYAMKKKSRSKAPRLNIQVITLQYHDNAAEFVQRYIQSRFDFTISTSMYDGIEYQVCNLLDVYNRNLRLFDDYKLRITFFNKLQKSNHKKRVLKYTRRKFNSPKLLYGENLKLLRKDDAGFDLGHRRIKLSLQDFVNSHRTMLMSAELSNKRQKL